MSDRYESKVFDEIAKAFRTIAVESPDSSRMDYSDESLIYLGTAPSGTPEGQLAGWTLTQITLTATSAAFKKGIGSWTDRATVTYV